MIPKGISYINLRSLHVNQHLLWLGFGFDFVDFLHISIFTSANTWTMDLASGLRPSRRRLRCRWFFNLSRSANPIIDQKASVDRIFHKMTLIMSYKIASFSAGCHTKQYLSWQGIQIWPKKHTIWHFCKLQSVTKLPQDRFHWLPKRFKFEPMTFKLCLNETLYWHRKRY